MKISVRLLLLTLFFAGTYQGQAQIFGQGKDRIVLQLHRPDWVNKPDSIKTEWYNRGINVHGMLDVPLIGKHVAAGIGIGLSADNIYHRSTIVSDTNGTQLVPIHDSTEFKRNKMTSVYAEIPAEIRLRFKPQGSKYFVKMGVGVKAGMLLGSYTRYRGDGSVFGRLSTDATFKQYDVPELSRFRYGVTARIGWGPFNLFAFYAINPVFDKGQGPDMHSLSIGLSINGL